ncbi:MAG: peptidase M14 [Pseudomonadales bacterium]|nr:peptidase M14 [Pseudomonadales bacterium]
MLNQINELPDRLLDCEAHELHGLLGGPTLVYLPGRLQPALFIAVLMHGNETTGWDAIRAVLKKYEPGGGERALPRSVYFFIGNTAAAEQGLRHLPAQPDYNRVWPGTEQPPCAESAMMSQFVEFLREQGLFASIDLHNNTGLNPHYGCVNLVEPRCLHLAAMFSRTVVYFTTPRGVQSMAMSAICPAVTLECGKVGQQHGVDHAHEFIDACLHLSEHPQHDVAAHDIDLFHTTAVVKIPAHTRFGFAGEQLDLQLLDSLERYNFRELPAGTCFGRVRGDVALPLAAFNEQGIDVSADYFCLEGAQLVSRRPLMPSMLTLDPEIIRQDCLCYLMERY